MRGERGWNSRKKIEQEQKNNERVRGTKRTREKEKVRLYITFC